MLVSSGADRVHGVLELRRLALGELPADRLPRGHHLLLAALLDFRDFLQKNVQLLNQ